MKSPKLLLTGLALGATALAVSLAILAAEPTFRALAAVPGGTPPALYSFAEVYRLTVAGAGASASLPLDSSVEAPVRVAVAQPPLGTEVRFLISSVPPRDKWLLLLAGVALAGWVAHRRLAHSL